MRREEGGVFCEWKFATTTNDPELECFALRFSLKLIFASYLEPPVLRVHLSWFRTSESIVALRWVSLFTIDRTNRSISHCLPTSSSVLLNRQVLKIVSPLLVNHLNQINLKKCQRTTIRFWFRKRRVSKSTIWALWGKCVMLRQFTSVRRLHRINTLGQLANRSKRLSN